MSNYELNLSMTEDNNVGLIKIRQDDTETQKFTIILTSHSKIVDLTGCEVYFCTKVGQGIVDDKAKLIDAKKGLFEYTLIPQAWQKTGEVKAYFSIRKGDSVDSTRMFKYLVVPSINNCIVTGNYIYDMEELKRKWEETLSNIDVNFTDIKKIIAEANARVDMLEEALQNADFYTKAEMNKFISDLRIEINEKYLSFKDYKINVDNTTSMTMRLDLKGRKTGSLKENPHSYLYDVGTKLLLPTSFRYGLINDDKMLWNSYESLEDIDGYYVHTTSKAQGNYAQQLAKFDVVEALARKFSVMQNMTFDEKLAFARKIITSMNFCVYGFGKNPTGYRITLMLRSKNSYNTAGAHTNDSIQPLSSSQNSDCLNDDGFAYMLMYAQSSDGIIGSELKIDYIYLDLVLNVPLNAISFDLHDKVVDLTINDTVVSTVSDVKIKVLNDKLEDVRATLDKKVDVLSQRELLWKGLYMMTLSQRITPTKKMSECQNGWRIKWARYTVSTQTVDEAYCVYQYITAQGSCSVMLPHFGASNEWTMKGLSAVTDTYIQGHDLNNNNNSSGSNYKMVAIAVESF